MKITICDLCKKDGKLIEAPKRMIIKHHTNLRIDFCDNCKDKIPKDTNEFVKLRYSLDGIKLSDPEIKSVLAYS
jgi:hypothetical protein